MTRDEQQAPVLVAGGTGTTGRRVAAGLRARGVAARIGSRTGTPPFDWHDPGTWDAALAGVRAAYLAYAPDLAAPGAPTTVGAFARRAARAGVERLVLLSGRGEPEAQRAEAAVADAGIPWTVVRSSWFLQNFSEGAFAAALSSGVLALPADAVPEPFVDVDDVAAVAVAALLEDGHAGTVHETTGPEALTFADAVAVIARATGRALRYETVPMADFRRALRADGTPPEVVALLGYLFEEVLDGRNARPADGVLRALGRAPRDVDAFAATAARAGAWRAPEAVR
ncbi:NmrA family NAD(P)-binding protein [Patulibacter sp. S7RM1-6]